MVPQLPIELIEQLRLPSVGVQPASIGFNSCTLESDHFVCVRQRAEGSELPEVIIINLKNGNSVMRRPIKADSAIVHWRKEIVALKAGSTTLQIFDLAEKRRLRSASLSSNVVFWKWVNEMTLGLVTDRSVYHWKIYDSEPQKLFDRDQNLAGCQIINYQVSDNEKWMAVVGITESRGRVVGNMQLYSKDRDISQAIEGHAATFATLRLEDAAADTRLFTFANRSAAGAKLRIVEIDRQALNPAFQDKAVDIQFPAAAIGDFPVGIQVLRKYRIVYLMTKYGFIHLYDLETGTMIFWNRISSETVFTTVPNEDGTGIVTINRAGQVLSVRIDENTVIPYLLQKPGNAYLAYKLAARAGLPGAKQPYQLHFDQLMAKGDYQNAVKTAASSPQGFLRTPQTIERFKQVPQKQGQLSVIIEYFGMLIDKGKLDQHESLELARPVLAQNRKHLLEKWMKEGKLGCSEQLGDLVRLYDEALAQQIYQEAGVWQKVTSDMAEPQKSFDLILPDSRPVSHTPDSKTLPQSNQKRDDVAELLPQEAAQQQRGVLEAAKQPGKVLGVEPEATPSSTRHVREVLRVTGSSDPVNPTKPLVETASVRLNKFFVEGDEPRSGFTDYEIQQISRLLSQVNSHWSKVPRTYIALRTIGCLNVLDSFLDLGFSDHWLPVTERSLPQCLRASQRSAFVTAQKLVITKSVDLEKAEKGQHQHFSRGEPLPFERKGILGSGGFGEVDRVFSLISFQEYARKRVKRSNVFSGHKAEKVKQFIAEIEVLKRLKHRHIVEFVGSYTDSTYLGLIMSPVADMDLDAYLDRADTTKHKELRTFFGCLATALEYLHEQRVRHKDIKPGNILIYGGDVLFADFGLAFDFADVKGSTTVGAVNGMTPRYCAPEVALFEGRNTSSDIWSLGIVFLEMIAVLKGKVTGYVYDYLKEHGSRQSLIRTNADGLNELIAELKGEGSPNDNAALEWVQDMLVVQAQSRPTAASLVVSILATSRQANRNGVFCGICCSSPDTDSLSSDDALSEI